jgi:hypothetical protein
MVTVLERGDIGFFYRPIVQPADALELPAGVQSFFLVLSPAGGVHRRVRVGRKRMPASSHERLWARVERVGALQRVIGDQLEAERYSTKTRGERYQPGARPIARGCYAFARHDDHTHFVYRLDHVEHDVPDEVVPDAGNDLVLFASPTNVGRAAPPKGVRRTIEADSGPRWTAVGDPRQLDSEGAELVLVGVGDDPEELGIDVEAQARDAITASARSR